MLRAPPGSLPTIPQHLNSASKLKKKKVQLPEAAFSNNIIRLRSSPQQTSVWTDFGLHHTDSVCAAQRLNRLQTTLGYRAPRHYTFLHSSPPRRHISLAIHGLSAADSVERPLPMLVCLPCALRLRNALEWSWAALERSRACEGKRCLLHVRKPNSQDLTARHRPGMCRAREGCSMHRVKRVLCSAGKVWRTVSENESKYCAKTSGIFNYLIFPSPIWNIFLARAFRDHRSTV